jgi:aminotransferase
MAKISDEKYIIPQGSLISYFSNKVKKDGGINLAQGIPGFQPPQELLDILKEISHENIHQYAPGNGNLKLIEILNLKYRYFGLEKDNLLVVQGVTEAITLLYIYFRQILNADFSVMAFDPVYETYNNIPKIFGNRFVSFVLDSETIDFNKFEKTIIDNNVKVFYLSSPGNPYGRIYNKSEIDEIIQLSLKHNFFVVFDAVYQELYFTNPPYIPLHQFNDNLFYVNSFSKMLSVTGWRIGYLIASNKHMNRIKSIHDYTGLCAPSILQEAIAQYLEQEYYGKSYVLALREKLNKSFSLLKNELIELGFQIPKIEGGYFVWAKLPQKFSDGFKFAIELYEQEKVAVIPGIHFSKNAANFIRFNIAHESEVIEEGIQRIRKFINNA